MTITCGSRHRLAKGFSVVVGLLLLLLALPTWASDAQSCDTATIDTIAEQLKRPDITLPGEDDWWDGPLLAAACKPWPDDHQLLAVVLAYLAPGETAVQGERTDHMLVALLDTKTGRLRQRYDTTVEEDAGLQLMRESLSLDTARYRLAPGIRALGYVVHNLARGASCPDGGADDELTLLTPEGNKLRPVFSVYLAEWHTLHGTRCVETSGFLQESASITLSLDKQMTRGFANLMVTAQVSADQPDGSTKVRTARQVVAYDGKRYSFDPYTVFWQDRLLEQP